MTLVVIKIHSVVDPRSIGSVGCSVRKWISLVFENDWGEAFVKIISYFEAL